MPQFNAWIDGGWRVVVLTPSRPSIEFTGHSTYSEGWANWSIRYTLNGDVVIRECTDYSLDCDGRHSVFNDSECNISELSSNPVEDFETGETVMTPRWQETSSGQRDQYAEMAGY